MDHDLIQFLAWVGFWLLLFVTLNALHAELPEDEQ